MTFNNSIEGSLAALQSGKRKQPAPMVDFDPITLTICCEEDIAPHTEVDRQTCFGVQEISVSSTPEPEVEVVQEPQANSGGYCRRRPLGLLTPLSFASNGSYASNGSTPLTTPSSAKFEGAKRQRTPKHMVTGVDGQDSAPSLCEGSPSSHRSPSNKLQVPRPRPRRLRLLSLSNTPSSCGSTFKLLLSPRTPDPVRSDLKLLAGDVLTIMFDFDGTLTATPGDAHGNAGGKPGQRGQKEAELCARAPMLAPRLQALREAGILLGIISKSSEATIRQSLMSAGLAEHFQGPIVGTAVGLEGKAGFIRDLLTNGSLQHLSGCGDVLLIDDDVRELDRARTSGIQTYPAPAQGGLQELDFVEIFESLGLQIAPSPAAALSATAATMHGPLGIVCGGA